MALEETYVNCMAEQKQHVFQCTVTCCPGGIDAEDSANRQGDEADG